jgi:hypothetical protein
MHTRCRGVSARRATAAFVVALAATGALSPVARSAQSLMHYVGKLPDTQTHLANAHGSLLLDPVHRRGYTYYRVTTNGHDALVLKRFDIDRVVNGQFAELSPIRIEAPATSLTAGDRSRIAVDDPGWEPMMSIDPASGYLFYSATGALYAVNGMTGAVSKWVASPNPGGLSDDQAPLPSGLSSAGPTAGVNFQTVDGEPRLFTVGAFQPPGASATGAWIAGWDARPPTATVPATENRQLWFWPIRTCNNLSRIGTQSQSVVFRTENWIYTFCDSSADNSGKGVVRIHLAPAAPGGEPQPDGTEEIFPGVTGSNIDTYGDAGSERVYIMSSNPNGGRNVLVFDGRASEGRGAYIGQIALSQGDLVQSAAGLNPKVGRWYFQSPEGLWFQDGRLSRLAQATNVARDDQGAKTGFATWRPLRVDWGHTPPRVFSQRDGYYAVYEDTAPLPSPPLPPTERTNNQPESSGVGVYTGVTSAYGVRARIMRGLSSFWPSGVAVSLENPTNGDRNSPGYYLTDPFFYHAGDCGSRDREVTIGRVLQTELSGGLTERTARASGLAADPEVHHRSAPDETQTRSDVENPDPCLSGFLTAMSGRSQSTGAKGEAWPFARASCAGDVTKTAAAASPFSGTAMFTCAADGDKPFVKADTVTPLSPVAGAALVTVGDVETHTSSERLPNQGLTSNATAIVRDITVAGTVHIGEMIVKATSHAEGRAGTAKATRSREFLGVTVNGTTLCAVSCDETAVLEALNRAIGPYGYVRAADPEPDDVLGTKLGTLSVVQKNLLQQDADTTVNRDETVEWPGLEIGVYRDAQQRGGGRWIMQLGGVFTQAQFGVIDAIGSDTDGGATAVSVDASDFGGAAPDVLGSDTGTFGFEGTLAAPPAGGRTNGNPVLMTVGTVASQVRSGIGFAFTNPGGALLLASLWSLLVAPAYIASRRRLLNTIVQS